jgi:hypothetical protein
MPPTLWVHKFNEEPPRCRFLFLSWCIQGFHLLEIAYHLVGLDIQIPPSAIPRPGNIHLILNPVVLLESALALIFFLFYLPYILFGFPYHFFPPGVRESRAPPLYPHSITIKLMIGKPVFFFFEIIDGNISSTPSSILPENKCSPPGVRFRS